MMYYAAVVLRHICIVYTSVSRAFPFLSAQVTSYHQQPDEGRDGRPCPVPDL
jgi:hypothetical protein